MQSWECVRGFAGCGKTRFGICVTEQHLTSSSSSHTTTGNSNSNTAAVMVVASKFDKDALRLQTLAWPKGHAHNCHSLCLAWFGMGKTDAELSRATQWLEDQHCLPLEQNVDVLATTTTNQQTPVRFDARQPHHHHHHRYPARAACVQLVLDNVDRWYGLLWRFVLALVGYAVGHHRQKVIIISLCSPWWTPPEQVAKFMGSRWKNDIVLSGSKWLPYGIAYFIVHYLCNPPPPSASGSGWWTENTSAVLLIGTKSPTPPPNTFAGAHAEETKDYWLDDVVTVSPVLCVQWPSSNWTGGTVGGGGHSSANQLIQPRYARGRAVVVVTNIEQWHAARTLFTCIEVHNANHVPREVLADMLSHCTTRAKLHIIVPRLAAAPAAAAAAVGRGAGPTSFSVSSIMKTLQSQQHIHNKQDLLQKCVSLHVRCVGTHALGLHQLTSADQQILAKDIQLLPRRVLGQLIPTLLQMRLMNLGPIDLDQVLEHCCAANGSTSSSSASDSGYRTSRAPRAPRVQQQLLSRGTRDVLCQVVAGLEHTVLGLWETTTRAPKESTTSRPSPPCTTTTIPAASLHFEKEVSLQTSHSSRDEENSTSTIHGRIDLSLGARAVLIEFKCKSRPLGVLDVLQVALYQAMCPHHHVLLIDVLRGQTYELQLLPQDVVARKTFVQQVLALTHS